MTDATDTHAPWPKWACSCEVAQGDNPDCPQHSPNLEQRVCQMRLGCTAAMTHQPTCPQLAKAKLDGGNRGELDACTRHTDCPAAIHVVGCPSVLRDPVEVRTLTGEVSTLPGEVTWPERPLPEDTAGVWVTYRRVAGVALPLAPYPTEVAALRAALSGPAAGAVWWPYDLDWSEVSPTMGAHLEGVHS